ncbi:MAG TPA: DUF58 domain-containing protein [Spirochaetia bacterium]|nr:DUF58 domain-containing protein [Spirochaetia bacterium]
MPVPASAPERILQRLDWTVIRRLDGLLQGNYRTVFRGFGLELAELREYQFNDDVRAIDWYVTARMQTPYIRLRVEDRDLTAWFLLDLSPSMDYGTARTRKSDMLVDCVGVLARLLTRHGNRVGALVFNGSAIHVIPAESGRMQVLRLLNDVMEEPRLPRTPMTRLATLLEAAERVVRRPSLVFIVSDFISAPGWDRPLSILTQRHEAVAVRLLDPRETSLPDIGLVVLEDAESGQQLHIDTHDAGFRARFETAARTREEQLRSALARSATDLLEVSTEGDLVEEIVRFVNLRKRKRSSATSGVSARPGSAREEAVDGIKGESA